MFTRVDSRHEFSNEEKSCVLVIMYHLVGRLKDVYVRRILGGVDEASFLLTG